MRDEIHRIVRELGITTVFVTHDQGEALVLSDIVAVMNGGVDRADRHAARESIAARKRRSSPISSAAQMSSRARLRLARQHSRPTGGIAIPLPADADAAVKAIADPPGGHRSVGVDRRRRGLPASSSSARFLGGIIEYTSSAAGTGV